MNIYTDIILVGIFINFLNYLIATMCNFHNLKSPSYNRAKDYYSYIDFRKMTLYSKSRSRAEVVFIFLSIMGLLFFWMFEGFRLLDEFVRSFNINFIVESIIYILVIFSFFILLLLIYDIYINFYLDKKYRISRMNVIEFAKSKFKRFAIYYLNALIILSSLFFFNHYFGYDFWWAFWLFASIIIILYDYLYPFIYLYFLNKVKNEITPELRNKILQFCDEIDFPISNINVFESSRKTNRLNAFFAGFGKSKNIIISDNIINNFTDSEILAVIGHEAGHYKLKHNIKNVILSIILLGFILFLFRILIDNIEIFNSFYVYNISFYVGIVLYTILLSILFIIISPLLNNYLRSHETQADTFSYLHTKNKSALISAIKKIYIINLYNPVPHPYYVFFYYKRNPAEERIKIIENL